MEQNGSTGAQRSQSQTRTSRTATSSHPSTTPRGSRAQTPPRTAWGAPGVSQLARLMQSLARSADLEDRVDADLFDVTDSALAAMHQQSEDNRATITGLANGVDPVDRRHNMEWLMRAFESVRFKDAVLFQSALLLDRFYAARPGREVTVREAQQTLLAAVILAVKVDTRDDYPMKLSHIVQHLGQNTVPFEDVLHTESTMLPHLGYCVGTPTSFDFLEVLSTRVAHFHDLSILLAEYLLQLTLSDATVHWSAPHAVLAASALALSVLTLQAPPAAVTVILEDLQVIYPCLDPQADDPAVVLARCCTAVHSLWVESTTQPNSHAWPFAEHLRAKFHGRDRRYRDVLDVRPPANPPVAVQA